LQWKKGDFLETQWNSDETWGSLHNTKGRLYPRQKGVILKIHFVHRFYRIEGFSQRQQGDFIILRQMRDVTWGNRGKLYMRQTGDFTRD
jgi:hypothetical protein